MASQFAAVTLCNIKWEACDEELKVLIGLLVRLLKKVLLEALGIKIGASLSLSARTETSPTYNAPRANTQLQLSASSACA